MKKKVVVFYFDKSKDPRVFVNPPSIAELQKVGNILVNPYIPKGISPNNWKLVNGRISSKVAVETAFPESKHINPTVFRWFKPFVLVALSGLLVLNLYQEKESIIELLVKLQSLF